MKLKKIPFLYLLSAVLLALSFLANCSNSPKAEKEPDIWSLFDRGETGKAKAFFKGKLDVNIRDSYGRTPLHRAAELGDSELAAFFIALGAKVDALDGGGRTPLNIAAASVDAPVAAVLARAGADIHYSASRGQASGGRASGGQMSDGFSPAQAALTTETYGNGSFLDALLTPDSILKTDSYGNTILHLAAIKGSSHAVKAILARGAPVNKKENSGKSALDLALARPDSREHAAAAEALILAGGYSSTELYAYLSPAVRSSNYNIQLADGISPLHYSSRNGYMGITRYLLGKRVDVNIKNAAGMTPLHEAAQSGNLDIMEMLISINADVNTRDAKGNTVMHIAMPVDKQKAGIDLLLKSGGNPNIKDDHGDTPLHIAISLNMEADVIKSLISARSGLDMRNIEGKTPLYIALDHGRTAAIPMLLEQGADIFAADNRGITPFQLALINNDANLAAMITPKTVTLSDSLGNTQLHLAVLYGAEGHIVSKILDYKANVNARNQAGNTALHLAVQKNNGDSGALLLSRGADIFAVNAREQSPLYLALTSGMAVRDWMLSQKSISNRDGPGNGVLHYAASWKMDKLIPELVKRGAEVESQNATGETPLFIAVKQNSPLTVTALITSGAQVGLRDTFGNSALHTAVRWNAQAASEALIYAGADVNAHNILGKTPLHDAVRYDVRGIEETLVLHGARLEERDNDGNTPFMEAIIAGMASSAERLAGLGADPTTRNARGDTPLHIAVAINRSDAATMLLNFGASIHARNSIGTTPFETALATSPGMVSTLLTRDRIFASDDNGYSPLHIAVLTDAPREMLVAIINQGARVSTIDGFGQTPLRIAIERENWEAARVLADSGSNVFAVAADGESPATVALKKGAAAVRPVFSGRAIASRDSIGNTILHYAAQHGKRDTIILLLELGANKGLKNMANESPLDIAKRWNQTEVERLLSG